MTAITGERSSPDPLPPGSSTARESGTAMGIGEDCVEQSAERDAVLIVALELAPSMGWTSAMLAHAAGQAGFPGQAVSLFPTGPVGAIRAWMDLVDRQMAAAAEAEALILRPVPSRIRRLVEWRLRLLGPHRAALRRALGLLALPWHARQAVAAAARSVDSIWDAAGDRSADASWYTRRASLAGIYLATIAFWLRGSALEETVARQQALAFLDRRLAMLAAVHRLRRRSLRPRRV